MQLQAASAALEQHHAQLAARQQQLQQHTHQLEQQSAALGADSLSPPAAQKPIVTPAAVSAAVQPLAELSQQLQQDVTTLASQHKQLHAAAKRLCSGFRAGGSIIRARALELGASLEKHCAGGMSGRQQLAGSAPQHRAAAGSSLPLVVAAAVVQHWNDVEMLLAALHQTCEAVLQPLAESEAAGGSSSIQQTHQQDGLTTATDTACVTQQHNSSSSSTARRRAVKTCKRLVDGLQQLLTTGDQERMLLQELSAGLTTGHRRQQQEQQKQGQQQAHAVTDNRHQVDQQHKQQQQQPGGLKTLESTHPGHSRPLTSTRVSEEGLGRLLAELQDSLSAAGAIPYPEHSTTQSSQHRVPGCKGRAASSGTSAASLPTRGRRSTAGAAEGAPGGGQGSKVQPGAGAGSTRAGAGAEGVAAWLQPHSSPAQGFHEPPAASGAALLHEEQWLGNHHHLQLEQRQRKDKGPSGTPSAASDAGTSRADEAIRASIRRVERAAMLEKIKLLQQQGRDMSCAK